MAEILKRRDHTLDAMKAVAIFLVVWGHSIQLLVQIPYKQNPLCLFLYSFHMPWFMALTGYFASSLLRYKPKDAFVKRFRELLLPAIVFTTIYVVFGVYDDGSIKRFIVHQIYDFWFLKSAFVCALLFYLSIYLSCAEKYCRFILLAGSLAVALCISGWWVNAMYPCFLLGYVLNRAKEWFSKYSLYILLISACIFAVVYRMYDTDVYRFAWRFSLISGISLYKFYLIKITLGITATIFLFAVFRLLGKSRVMRRFYASLSFIGTRTLGVYLIQTLIIENILVKFISIASDKWCDLKTISLPLIIAAVSLAFCILIVRIMENNRHTSYLMLGKKKHPDLSAQRG